jgi:hypothetical protein
MATVSCPGCQQRDTRIQQLEQRVADLEAQLRDLQARLATNASNSRTPPSANPPRAPKPVLKTPTGKKPGGQPGHPAHVKRRLPPEHLQQVIPFVPSQCDHCHQPLPPDLGPDDPEPTWDQVADLPTPKTPGLRGRVGPRRSEAPTQRGYRRASTRARRDGAAGVGVPPNTGDAGELVPRGSGRGKGDRVTELWSGHRARTPSLGTPVHATATDSEADKRTRDWTSRRP